MLVRAAAFCGAMAVSAAISAQVLDLGRYRHTGPLPLPALPDGPAAEASAVTFNWDPGHLFVLGDEGQAVVEVTRSGALVSTMTLTGFEDTEGITYVGGAKVVLVEERLQDAFLLSYAAGG